MARRQGEGARGGPSRKSQSRQMMRWRADAGACNGNKIVRKLPSLSVAATAHKRSRHQQHTRARMQPAGPCALVRKRDVSASVSALTVRPSEQPFKSNTTSTALACCITLSITTNLTRHARDADGHARTTSTRVYERVRGTGQCQLENRVKPGQQRLLACTTGLHSWVTAIANALRFFHIHVVEWLQSLAPALSPCAAMYMT